MNIKVIYALPNKQFLLNIKLIKGSNVKDAIIQSGILLLCSNINLNKNKIGIYSKIVQLSDKLSDGDRVEIYRPLIVDPKDIRRKLIKNKKF